MDYLVSQTTFLPDLRDFVAANHYTRSYPRNVERCYKMTDTEGSLLGVILYTRFSRLQSRLKYRNMFELARVILVDDTKKNAESYFIAQTLQHLKRHSRVSAIISYADPTEGHKGVIYLAANFKMIGNSRESYHYATAHGDRVHKKRIWSEAKKLGLSERPYADSLGLLRVPEMPKLIFKYSFQRKVCSGSGVIYKATAPDGRVYIGQTVNGLDFRRRSHEVAARNKGTFLLSQGLRDFDFNFTWEVLETVSADRLDEREMLHIAAYNSTDRTKGFNNVDWNRFQDAAPDEALLEFFKLRKQGLAYKEIAKATQFSVGYVASILWGRLRPTVRQKWLSSNADVQKVFAPTSPANQQKALLLYYGEKLTVIEVSKRLGISYTQAMNYIRGTTNRDLFAQFAQQHGVTPLTNHLLKDEKILLAFDLRQQGIPDRDIVLRLGIGSTYLSQLMNGHIKPEVKALWESRNGAAPSARSRASKDLWQSGVFDKVIAREVVSAEGVRYRSIAEAAASIGVSNTALKKALDKGRSCQGKLFSYADGDRESKVVVKKLPKTARAVSLQDGTTYPTVAEAARALGVSAQSLDKTIKRGGICKSQRVWFKDQSP